MQLTSCGRLPPDLVAIWLFDYGRFAADDYAQHILGAYLAILANSLGAFVASVFETAVDSLCSQGQTGVFHAAILLFWPFGIPTWGNISALSKLSLFDNFDPIKTGYFFKKHAEF